MPLPPPPQPPTLGIVEWFSWAQTQFSEQKQQILVCAQRLQGLEVREGARARAEGQLQVNSVQPNRSSLVQPNLSNRELQIDAPVNSSRDSTAGDMVNTLTAPVNSNRDSSRELVIAAPQNSGDAPAELIQSGAPIATTAAAAEASGVHPVPAMNTVQTAAGAHPVPAMNTVQTAANAEASGAHPIPAANTAATAAAAEALGADPVPATNTSSSVEQPSTAQAVAPAGPGAEKVAVAGAVPQDDKVTPTSVFTGLVDNPAIPANPAVPAQGSTESISAQFPSTGLAGTASSPNTATGTGPGTESGTYIPTTDPMLASSQNLVQPPGTGSGTYIPAADPMLASSQNLVQPPGTGSGTSFSFSEALSQTVTSLPSASVSMVASSQNLVQPTGPGSGNDVPGASFPMVASSQNPSQPISLAQVDLLMQRVSHECESRIMQRVNAQLLAEDYEGKIMKTVNAQLRAFRTEITVRVDERVQDALRIPDEPQPREPSVYQVDMESSAALAAMEKQLDDTNSATAKLSSALSETEQRIEGREARVLAQVDKEIELKTVDITSQAEHAAQRMIQSAKALFKVPNPLDSAEMKGWMESLNKERQEFESKLTESESKLRSLALAVAPALELVHAAVPAIDQEFFTPLESRTSSREALPQVGRHSVQTSEEIQEEFRKAEEKQKRMVLEEIRKAEAFVMQFASDSVDQAPAKFQSVIKIDPGLRLFDRGAPSLSRKQSIISSKRSDVDSPRPSSKESSLGLPRLSKDEEKIDIDRRQDNELSAMRKRAQEETVWAEREIERTRNELKRNSLNTQSQFLEMQQQMQSKLADVGNEWKSAAEQREALKETLDLLGREQSGAINRILQLENSIMKFTQQVHDRENLLNDRLKKVEEDVAKKRPLVTKRRDSAGNLDDFDLETTGGHKPTIKKRMSQVNIGEFYLNEVKAVAEEWQNKVPAFQFLKGADIFAELGPGPSGILLADMWKRLHTATEDRERTTEMLKAVCQVLPKRRVQQLQGKLLRTKSQPDLAQNQEWKWFDKRASGIALDPRELEELEAFDGKKSEERRDKSEARRSTDEDAPRFKERRKIKKEAAPIMKKNGGPTSSGASSILALSSAIPQQESDGQDEQIKEELPEEAVAPQIEEADHLKNSSPRLDKSQFDSNISEAVESTASRDEDEVAPLPQKLSSTDLLAPDSPKKMSSGRVAFSRAPTDVMAFDPDEPSVSLCQSLKQKDDDEEALNKDLRTLAEKCESDATCWRDHVTTLAMNEAELRAQISDLQNKFEIISPSRPGSTANKNEAVPPQQMMLKLKAKVDGTLEPLVKQNTEKLEAVRAELRDLSEVLRKTQDKCNKKADRSDVDDIIMWMQNFNDEKNSKHALTIPIVEKMLAESNQQLNSEVAEIRDEVQRLSQIKKDSEKLKNFALESVNLKRDVTAQMANSKSMLSEVERRIEERLENVRKDASSDRVTPRDLDGAVQRIARIESSMRDFKDTNQLLGNVQGNARVARGESKEPSAVGAEVFKRVVLNMEDRMIQIERKLTGLDAKKVSGRQHGEDVESISAEVAARNQSVQSYNMSSVASTPYPPLPPNPPNPPRGETTVEHPEAGRGRLQEHDSSQEKRSSSELPSLPALHVKVKPPEGSNGGSLSPRSTRIQSLHKGMQKPRNWHQLTPR